MRNTTWEMGWWRTNSFGGGEKDGEWSGSLLLGRRDFGMVCGGVWERERRGEEGKGEEEEEREGKDLSLFQYF